MGPPEIAKMPIYLGDVEKKTARSAGGSHRWAAEMAGVCGWRNGERCCEGFHRSSYWNKA